MLHCDDAQNGVGPSFTVHAPFEAPITVYCTRRNVLVGTFIKLLLRNVGGSEKFEDKKRHFQSVLEGNAPSHSTITLKVKRDQILKDVRIDNFTLLEMPLREDFSFEISGQGKILYGI